MSSLLTTQITRYIQDPLTHHFNDLALEIFDYQFSHNADFAHLCQVAQITPKQIKSWEDIPAVSVEHFKTHTLSCIPPHQCPRVFHTSGTTRPDLQGKHYHPTLEIYDLSMLLNFKKHFFDHSGKATMVSLFPDETHKPNSSLAHYLSLAKHHFADNPEQTFVGEEGLAYEKVAQILYQASEDQKPIVLLGASYSFVHFIENCQLHKRQFNLAAGSKVLDTGGYKGQSREIARDEFYQLLNTILGVELSQCINMYGMTELSTQMYDRGQGTPQSYLGYQGPHWLRSRVLDPLSMQEVEVGAMGVLAHTDLANLNSVTTILTEDIAVRTPAGFQLMGRAKGSQAQGCSITADELFATRP
ncbi:MAG: long-chain fatty acid--CoA ligase [Gammaproteobacteria bacterium]|nr:long-chain fatty acid--CoA ligase [Gammaproteobacteria bacterium]